MEKSLIMGIAAAGLFAVVGVVGMVSAEQTAPEAVLSEAQAVEIALDAAPGQVQRTELEQEDGAAIYEIDILMADGVAMEVEVDAVSGEVLEVGPDTD